MDEQFIRVPDPHLALLLQRALFKDDGDDFAAALASYIRSTGLQISDEALELISVAARIVRR